MSISATLSSDAGISTVEKTGPSFWLWAALVVGLVAVAGSLYLSLGMGLKACPLCFYQRTFALSVVSVLGLGLLVGAGRAEHLGLLALPLAIGGMGVALFHVYLEVKGTLECPQGILGFGSAPQQSLAVFVPLVVLLFLDVLSGSDGNRWLSLAGALVLGGLLVVASLIANPPFPPKPEKPYPQPAEICRPPYRAVETTQP